MLLIYIFSICIAINSCLLSNVDLVSCSKYDNSESTNLFNNFYKNKISASEKIYHNKSDEQLIRIEIIKGKILEKLGLKDVPKVNEKISCKIANNQLYDILEDEQENAILRSNLQRQYVSSLKVDQFKNTQINTEINQLVGDEPISQVYLFPIKSKNENRFLFNLTLNSKQKEGNGIDQPKNFILTLRKKSEKQLSDRCKVIIYQKSFNGLEKIDLLNKNLIRIGTLETADYVSTTNNLIKFNLNALMPNLLEPFRSSDSTFLEGEKLFLFDTIDCDFDSAMITVEYEHIKKERNRRSVDCEPNGQTTGCCREPFYVNFTKIGWDNWILQPSGYNAYYCKGKCDISHARYHHTLLIGKFPSVVTQCCSPATMSAISLIYVDENNYVFKKNLPNMVVDKCDCA